MSCGCGSGVDSSTNFVCVVLGVAALVVFCVLVCCDVFVLSCLSCLVCVFLILLPNEVSYAFYDMALDTDMAHT